MLIDSVTDPHGKVYHSGYFFRDNQTQPLKKFIVLVSLYLRAKLIQSFIIKENKCALKFVKMMSNLLLKVN